MLPFAGCETSHPQITQISQIGSGVVGGGDGFLGRSPMPSEMSVIEKLPELVNANAALVRRGKWFTATWMAEVGTRQYRVVTEAGRIAAVQPVKTHLQSWVFAVRAGED